MLKLNNTISYRIKYMSEEHCMTRIKHLKGSHTFIKAPQPAHQRILNCWLFLCLGSVTWWTVIPTWDSFRLIYTSLITLPGLYNPSSADSSPNSDRSGIRHKGPVIYVPLPHVWNSLKKMHLKHEELGSYFIQWVEFCCYSWGGWLCWELSFEKVVKF